MSSAISCIVIKSDQISSRIPQPGQIVAVEGEPGLYVVMDIDHQKRSAQLMEKSGRHRLSEVPFASIKSLNRKLADAIHHFLDWRAESKMDPP